MFEYPALYETAGDLSAKSQSTYLSLIRIEYALLFLAAVLSMNWSKEPTFFIVYAVVLLASLGVLICRSWMKPEQDWYRGRALAESIKTSSWRFVMRSSPFEDADSITIPRGEFREHLLAILKANRFIGDKMPPDSAAKQQIPASMEEVRSLNLEQRKVFYLEHRIKDQRKWYAAKAGANKRASKRWMFLGIAAYAVAIGLALTRVEYPNWELWPIEPVIVMASSFIGWTQIKKFNELASSYTLTAHEIGIIQNRVEEINEEENFSEFVNDAEQAFSREHTQWVARQQA
ncbi:hypothetical protein rosmuc_04179 [Roseovarius mucosus DSM 17069]|uniref:DUF4231 domain-containing protein n=1 Tax=Roseovarius mucosus DSM 17069 TaxID=1288298 RepID=A0A0A0HI81_9RHOB|nr:DUF4231 domain-containing protein [Roseovarius mucosus]KGM85843.1 hypothetical protein rosmuc_04179 [Roseovarius mucosus DSM 17069]